MTLETLLADFDRKITLADSAIDGTKAHAKQLALTLATALDGDDTAHAQVKISQLIDAGNRIDKIEAELTGLRKGREIIAEQIEIEALMASYETQPSIKLAGAMMLDIPESGIATEAY